MIAEELDISYSSVLRLDKQYQEAVINNTVNQLIDVDKAVIITAAESLDLDATAVVEGVKGLEKLSSEFQTTATAINSRVRTLLMSIDHVDELVALTDVLCKLNTSFVNTAQTQVNVQNNFGGEENAPSRYNQYLSDTPAS
jgi:hypothetical protein